MSITGPGSITATNLLAQNNMINQLNTLSQELGTGQAATTYSGLGSQAGSGVQLSAQLAAINGYSSTATTVGTTLTLAQSVLTQIGSCRHCGPAGDQPTERRFRSTIPARPRRSNPPRATSIKFFRRSIPRSGDNYMFSGSAVDQPSVAATGDILNGNGAQAGLTQVIAERLQADQGANVPPLGRLVIPPAARIDRLDRRGCRWLAVRLQACRRELELDRSGGDRSLGPADVDFGRSRRSNPNPGDSIAFNLTLPDGIQPNHHAAGDQRIRRRAPTSSPSAQRRRPPRPICKRR